MDRRSGGVATGRAAEDICDVGIVGGGIYGLVVGYHLARLGIDTMILDAGPIGAEASGANAGSIGVQNKPIRMQGITVRAAEAWASLHEVVGHDIGYERIGGFRIAHSDDDAARLRSQLPRQREAGVPVELVSATDLRREAAYLHDSVQLAAYCALDGLSNPLRTNLAYARAGREAGLRIRQGVPVHHIAQRRGSFDLHTPDGKIAAERLLIAAGAWSAGLAAMIDVPLPLTWAVNTVTITEPGRDLIPHLVTHVRGNLTVKQHHGRVLIGGAWRGDGDPFTAEKRVNLDSWRGNLGWASTAIPALRDFHILRAWAGIQANTPDRLFLMGPLEHAPGAFIFTGGSGGYTLAPHLGRCMAEWMTTSERPADAAPMDVRRFQIPPEIPAVRAPADPHSP